jgi:colanic acid/amylovoran biosynthesis glycosyltransferase
LRVAFLVTDFPAASETFILDQITGLIDCGCEVEIFPSQRGKPTAVHPEVVSYGLSNLCHVPKMPDSFIARPLHAIRAAVSDARHLGWPHLRSLNCLRYGRRAGSLRLFFDTAACSASRPFDVIHCHFGPNGLRGLALREIGALRGKLVTSFYGYDVSEFPRQRGRDVYAQLFAKGERFLAISQVMRQKLIELGCPPEKILVHRLGVNLEMLTLFPPTAPLSPVRILTISRLTPKKGLEYGLRAVAALVQEGVSVEYTVIGDGPLRPKIERLAHDLGLANVVRLTGWKSRPEIVTALSQSDILLAPSVTAESGDQEGTPVAIMEALACGVPVVSTLHAGIPEVVQDGVSGYLVPERDVGGLANVIRRLARDPALRASMGQQGRAHIQERHNIGKLSSRLIEIYSEFEGERSREMDGALQLPIDR